MSTSETTSEDRERYESLRKFTDNEPDYITDDEREALEKLKANDISNHEAFKLLDKVYWSAFTRGCTSID